MSDLKLNVPVNYCSPQMERYINGNIKLTCGGM